MSEPVDGSLWTKKNFIKIYNKNGTKLTKIPYSFLFRLQSVSKLLDQQHNRTLLIKVIKQSKRKKEKENHTFFLIVLVLVKQTFFRVALSPFSVQTKTKTKYHLVHVEIRCVINCSVFHKFINLYVWTGIFLLITVIYFILVFYKKLAKKLEKEYLKSENITNSGRFFSLVSGCYNIWDY